MTTGRINQVSIGISSTIISFQKLEKQTSCFNRIGRLLHSKAMRKRNSHSTKRLDISNSRWSAEAKHQRYNLKHLIRTASYYLTILVWCETWIQQVYEYKLSNTWLRFSPQSKHRKECLLHFNRRRGWADQQSANREPTLTQTAVVNVCSSSSKFSFLTTVHIV